MDADLAVVGAGPAGLAAAIQAAQRGLSVVVIDHKEGTLDKACGEGLMPGAVAQLRALGAKPEESHPFHGVVYRDGTHEAVGHFSRGTGLGVRRLHLHRSLHARAEALGVRRLHRKAGLVRQDDRGVTVAGLRARWLVAADGLRSPIRAQLGLERPTARPARVGLRQHFALAPRRSLVEVHWSPHAEAYITPVGPKTVGVAFLFFADRPPPTGQGSRFAQVLQGFPDLRDWLRGAEPTSRVRGAGPFARRVRRRVAGRVLLVGDAAGYLDPLTGEGLRLGFEAAQAAVACIAAGRPRAYEAAWRRLARRYWVGTAGLLFLARSRWTRRLVVPVASRAPFVMQTAINLLAESQPQAVGVRPRLLPLRGPETMGVR